MLYVRELMVSLHEHARASLENMFRAKLSADDSTNKSAALTMLQDLESRVCHCLEMQNHGSDHECALQALELQVRKDIEGLATYKKSVLGFKKPAHTDIPKMGAHLQARLPVPQ